MHKFYSINLHKSTYSLIDFVREWSVRSFVKIDQKRSLNKECNFKIVFSHYVIRKFLVEILLRISMYKSYSDQLLKVT